MLLYVRGVIGSGKSSIIKCMKKINKDKYEYDIKFVCEPIEQMIKYLNIGKEKSIKELQYFMLDHHRNIISSCASNRSTIHVIEGAPEDNLIF